MIIPYLGIVSCLISIAISDNILTKLTQTTRQLYDAIKNQTDQFADQYKNDYCFSGYQTIGLNDPINQGIVLLPMSPSQMDVKFMYFSCNNREISRNLSYLSPASDWTAVGFDPNILTRVLAHGWNENYPGNRVTGHKWMERMKNLFLNKSCVNVIAVDWSVPAQSLTYFQSAANTRVVGQMIGCVVNRLKTGLNADPNKFHLVGHSLGSQVVGFAGKRITNPKVGRMTVTDPAAPGFSGLGSDNHVDFGDAQCLTVMHTNGYQTLPGVDGLGDPNTCGNYDFIVNGGSKQPGCSLQETSTNLWEVLTTDPSNLKSATLNYTLCSHCISNNYAIVDQSLFDTSSKCQPIAYKCNSLDDFNAGKCGDCDNGLNCKPMDFNLDYWDNPNNCDSSAKYMKLYINTNNVFTPDYCLFHYQIIISSQNQCSDQLVLTLDSKQIDINCEENNTIESKDGFNRYTKLYTDSQELGSITTASVESSCVVSKIEIKYMSHIQENVRTGMSSTLCSTDGKQFNLC